MARYEFRCKRCNNIRELNVEMKEYDNIKDKQICYCGKNMERIYTPCSIQFKGSCWNKDGYTKNY